MLSNCQLFINDILLRRQLLSDSNNLVKEMSDLWTQTNAFSGFVCIGHNTVAVDHNRALSGRIYTSNHIHYRRLSGAVVSQKCEYLSLKYVERHVVDGFLNVTTTAKHFEQIFDFNHNFQTLGFALKVVARFD